MKIPPLINTVTNKTGTDSNPNVERGVVCYDFSRFSTDIFVVGLEGGYVVQCSTLGASELKGENNQKE